MPKIRVRSEELTQERLRRAGFRSEEHFIREINVSRSAWLHLKRAGQMELNIGVLEKVMRGLNMRAFDDLLELTPDEPGDLGHWPRGMSTREKVENHV